ncbi:hypothetical protein ARAM_005525 [Aspergillus rambellii]|uniref:Dicer-like protein 1 n=1 Tax=Aspergillus rambellii TaxID=308745 RepID=A0A0F8U1Q8_9EURO|nr:hypothetical protein ARAM_005525 [Aspergillus rambellii]
MDLEANNSSSDESQVDDNAHIQSIPERRKFQKAKFEALQVLVLLAKRTGALSDSHGKVEPPPAAQISTARLFLSKDQDHGVLDPREYQIELFERAKSENTIAVLATGAGKTLIAVLLLKHTIEKELNDRAEAKAHRVSFFLVDSVTLSFQQAGFLRNNLDQEVGHLFGDLGTDFLNKQTWEGHLKKAMVIVCTAEILDQCLLKAHILMEQINLLIFDEAHHAKKHHPYARIIRDSYLQVEPSKRPRIFGMTASPVDTKGDVVEGAMRLEKLLDSKIATASELTQIDRFIKRPTVEVWTYDKPMTPFATKLYSILDNRFGDVKALDSVFRFSWHASSELGRWCSDQVWIHALSPEVLPKIECKSKDVASRIQEASDVVRTHTFELPETPGVLSHKVQLLREKLSKHYRESTETKCIIFTQQRYTAQMLCSLFLTLKNPYLRPGVLIGVRAGDVSGMNITYRQQFLTLVKFRNGEINCLFATSVAEEGLDIADCNLVIRFDLYDTMIQYVQSRGRARHSNSRYANMVESNNFEHETRLREVQKAEKIMQVFCETLPEDRRLKGNDQDTILIHRKEEERVFTVANTGARLTYHSAISVLARYASSLQYEGDLSGRAAYVVLPVNSTFVCEVILPETSPIRGVTGNPAMSKSTAKRSAAFDTCILLKKHKLLDDYFNSVYHKRLPAMRNAKLAITSGKTKQYDMLLKPSLWSKGREVLPEKLYATVLKFKPAKSLVRALEDLVLLTRERIPVLPPFSIFLEEDDTETTVQFVSLKDSWMPSSAELEKITDFTLRIFRDVFQKTYASEPGNMPYWLTPANTHYGEQASVDPLDHINWKTVSLVNSTDEIFFEAGAPPDDLRNRFVFDPWNGRYRYFTIEVEDSLQPSSTPPSFVPHRRYMENIMSYCVSLSKNSRAQFFAKCDWNQPVLRAELVRLRRNMLDKMSNQERETETRCYICLEPLKVSSIPTSVAASCLAFPAIISRFDEYLITLEACRELDLVIKPELALEALTKDSDNTEEHRAQQIHFQRGMGKNYERLEFLGDCFLKMATSISLFIDNPEDDEFDYHVSRMCLICNKNLFNTAMKRGLYRYIRSQGFSRRTWYPEGLTLLQGKDHSKKLLVSAKHNLAEKTMADVCEALIGAALLTGSSTHRFDMAVKAVTVLVDSPNHSATCWQDYISLYTKPKYQVQNSTGFERELSRLVEKKVGYHFNYPRLLHSAFTHPSYPSAWAGVPCYQRLEFLGDSLLDMVCVDDLFLRFPDRDPQWLTEHKMAMVSNKFLGALAVKLGLHKHLRHFSAPLQSRITSYAEEIEAVVLESQEAVDFWTTTTDPPKCLPDMVEAYLGAIFIDANFDFGVIEEFFRCHIKPYFNDMAIYDTFANKHPTTFLHNRLTNEYGCIDYCLKTGEIPGIDGQPSRVLAAVIVHDTVIAEGMASSTRYAKVTASENALELLDSIGPAEFRAKYGCKCRETDDAPLPEMGTAI